MPLNLLREAMAKKVTAKPVQSVRKHGRKAPGTRIGLFVDWRGDATNSGPSAGRYGRSIRDGQ